MKTLKNGWIPSGLYGITESRLIHDESICSQVCQALEGGVAAIQYRQKGGTRSQRLRQATKLLELCQAAAVPFIVNDDLELAASIGADGVHLGKDDATPQAARRLLGPDAIIGVSCYNRFQLALEAQRVGADYVAFGSFFPSGTKPGAVRAEIELLQRALLELAIPVVAIGGITPENGGALVQAGADMLAVVHGLFGQPDIKKACAAFNQLFADKEELLP